MYSSFLRSLLLIRTTAVFFCLLVGSWWISSVVYARPHPTEDAYRRVWQLWHDAGVAEAHGEWILATKEYRKISEYASQLPTPVRDWHIANAEYGIAIAEANRDDKSKTQHAIEVAAEHKFRGWRPMRCVPALANLLGTHWIDSAESHWNAVDAHHTVRNTDQPTVIIHPHTPLPNPTVIVAFHGGHASYLDFAAHWQDVADSLNAIVVVPPGTERVSSISNSWGSSFRDIEAGVFPVIDSLRASQQLDTGRIYVAGFSQGAQAAMLMALLHPEFVRAAILIAGHVPQTFTDASIRASARRNIRFAAISGTLEENLMTEEMSKLTRALAAGGAQTRYQVVPEMTHEIPLDLAKILQSQWSWISAADRPD